MRVGIENSVVGLEIRGWFVSVNLLAYFTVNFTDLRLCRWLVS